MRFAPALKFLRRPARPGHRSVDPADMGTTCGLEAVLETGFEPSQSPLEGDAARQAFDNPMAWMGRGSRKAGSA